MILLRPSKSLSLLPVCPTGDGQVDFEEFMTILGPKLLSSDNREGFLGNTIDNIFWQVKDCSLFHIVNNRPHPHRLSSSCFSIPEHTPIVSLGSIAEPKCALVVP